MKLMLSGDKLNLEKVNILILDDNQQSLDILSQIVSGFGAKNIARCTSAVEARESLSKQPVDLILTDAQMPDENGYEFARWIRQAAPEPVKYTLMVLITGHTPQSEVTVARDCGVNFVVTKPLVPAVLLQRFHWLSRENRKFVECATYAGPDRRFKRQGPPADMEGRRRDDLKGDVGGVSGANMSQDEIDSLMKPTKASL